MITPPVRSAARSRSGCRACACCSSASTRPIRTGRTGPENLVEDVVVYTGTHDSDTARGWYDDARPVERRGRTSTRSSSARGIGERATEWALIRLAWESPARMAMTQAQDVLGLGSEGRMNMPGRARGSWRWRLRPGALTPDLAKRLREATVEAGRLS